MSTAFPSRINSLIHTPTAGDVKPIRSGLIDDRSRVRRQPTIVSHMHGVPQG